jgi:hypothetical protein
MLVGALIGAAFVVHSRFVWPLAIAAAAAAAVAAASHLLGRSGPPWTRLPSSAGHPSKVSLGKS